MLTLETTLGCSRFLQANDMCTCGMELCIDSGGAWALFSTYRVLLLETVQCKDIDGGDTNAELNRHIVLGAFVHHINAGQREGRELKHLPIKARRKTWPERIWLIVDPIPGGIVIFMCKLV